MFSRFALIPAAFIAVILCSCVTPGPAYHPSQAPDAAQVRVKNEGKFWEVYTGGKHIAASIIGVDGLPLRGGDIPSLSPLHLDAGKHEIIIKLLDAHVGENYIGIGRISADLKRQHTYQIKCTWDKFGETGTAKIYDTTNGTLTEIASSSLQLKRQMIIYI